MDPIAGAALGAVVKSTRKAKDDPKIRHALLLPAAQVVGNELAERLKVAFERNRAKRIENLEAHLRTADEVGGEGVLEDLADQPAFDDWIVAVSTVDPLDEELAAIWQAALLAMRQGIAERMRIVTISKQMLPDEAAEFVRFCKSPRNFKLNSRYLERFVNLGILETILERSNRTPFNKISIWIVLFLFANGLVPIFGSIFGAFTGIDNYWPELRFITSCGVIVLAGFTLLLGLALFRGQRRLSRDGLLLSSYALQVLERDRGQSQKPMNASRTTLARRRD